MFMPYLRGSFFAAFSIMTLLSFAKISADADATHWSNGISVDAEFLYWKVSQDQMQYAAVLPGGLQPIIQAFQGGGSAPVQVAANLNIIDPSFKYKPGFRIGVG